MNPDSMGRDERSGLSDAFHDDDGIDPRRYFERRSRRSGTDRKTLMLCAQVGEAVHAVLAGASGDPGLLDLELVAVEPAPDASRLRLVFCPREGADLRLAEQALGRSWPWLRSVVAEAIHRKRCPELDGVIVPEEAS